MYKKKKTEKNFPLWFSLWTFQFTLSSSHNWENYQPGALKIYWADLNSSKGVLIPIANSIDLTNSEISRNITSVLNHNKQTTIFWHRFKVLSVRLQYLTRGPEKVESVVLRVLNFTFQDPLLNECSKRKLWIEKA